LERALLDLSLPLNSAVITMFRNYLSHYLVGYYTTHQPDGAHIEAHCTCGDKLEGVVQMKARQ
jgi:hypothetical protein